MCGIAGIWNRNCGDLTDAELACFVDSLSHRGPDGRGIFRNRHDRLSLGHRRLAILDLSDAGSQPMSSFDSRFWLSFNGEIFNFVELRTELEAYGQEFNSHSDTEVVLAAYRQWGQECLLKFNGMWAIALWDDFEKRLFLSRDRFGIKPLYYVYTEKFFAFASEMKSFLSLECYDFDFDQDILSCLTFNINDLESSENCILKGIKRLPAGHNLVLNREGPPRIYRWWRTLDHLMNVPKRFEDQAEEFRSLFVDACRLRTRSDVPVATSLSGGLDSSSVICTLHSANPVSGFTSDWHKAFVACFEGTYLDERNYAKAVVDSCGADPVYTEIKIDDWMSRLEDIIFQFEEVYWVLPAGSWVNYQIMKKNGIKVSLDGHGADELLGGYHSVIQAEMRNALLFPPSFTRYLDLKRTLAGFHGGSNTIDVSILRDLKSVIGVSFVGPVAKKIYHLIKKFSSPTDYDTSLQKCYGNRVKPIANLNDEKLHSLSPLNRILYKYFHVDVLPTILRNFDRASMAHGVEVRMPFMDWRLVCYCFSLPDESKIGRGFSKLILREAMKGILPESIRNRTNKIGFTSPMSEWIKGPLKEIFFETITSSDFLHSVNWNGLEIRDAVFHLSQDGKWDSCEQYWPYVNLQLLINIFKKRRVVNV